MCVAPRGRLIHIRVYIRASPENTDVTGTPPSFSPVRYAAGPISIYMYKRLYTRENTTESEREMGGKGRERKPHSARNVYVEARAGRKFIELIEYNRALRTVRPPSLPLSLSSSLAHNDDSGLDAFLCVSYILLHTNTPVCVLLSLSGPDHCALAPCF